MVGGETVEGAAGRSLQQRSDLRDGNSWWVTCVALLAALTSNLLAHAAALLA